MAKAPAYEAEVFGQPKWGFDSPHLNHTVRFMCLTLFDLE
jgi:hypothetical protein